jgi:SprT-like family protein
LATSLFDDPFVGMRQPAAPEPLESRLRRLGLRDVDRIETHANRTVMLSLRRRVLRIHRGYAHAPDAVLSAVVTFLRRGTHRDTRRAAERAFLAFPVHLHVPPPPRRERVEAERPGDRACIAGLTALHDQFNQRWFGGTLRAVPIRLSSRMRRRLGELRVSLLTGAPEAITLSRRHLRRDSPADVEETLLHEMVHQWQAETGATLDHGTAFRRKARDVGIVPRATRRVD